ncbi:MAG: tetratricopeptide repeat protein [Bergeyella zoohelcum]|nr:tetratricopeptide repeat protein [Bergeyella zoohelcum]
MIAKRYFLFGVLLFCADFALAQKSYNALIHEGNKAFESKEYETSTSKYMEALEKNQKDFTAHYNLGNTFYKRKMYDEAKAEYEKAEKLAKNKSDKAAALYNKGNAHMKTNNAEAAVESYRKALKETPYDENIRKNYEVAKRKQQEKQQQNNNSQNDNNQQKDQNQQNKTKADSDEKSPDGKSPQGGKNAPTKGNAGGEQQNEPKKSVNTMPKNLQDNILRHIEGKERETARRILNKNSYLMPKSNEKDW